MARAEKRSLVIKHEDTENDAYRTFRWTTDAGGSVVCEVDGVVTTSSTKELLTGAAETRQAFRIGPGITSIESRGLDERTVLGLLTFAEEADPQDWAEWATSEVDEQLEQIDAPGEFRVGRWRIRYGPNPIRVLTDNETFLPISWDSRWPTTPTTWEPMYEWSFSNDGTGPITWHGSCSAGLLAPGLLLEVASGDQDPGSRLWTFDRENLEEVLAESAYHWAAPLITSWFGTPGLSIEERAAADEASSDNYRRFALTCEHSLAERVVERLLARVPELDQARRALTDPASHRGQVVYAWLRGIAGTIPIHQKADWFTVHEAMLGEIGPPTPLTVEELQQRATQQAAAAAERRKQAHRQLTDQVQSALHPTPDDWEVRNITARLQDLNLAHQRIAEARTLLGVKGDAPVKFHHAQQRIAERPGDADWDTTVWSAFWTVSRAPSSTEKADLKRRLAKEKAKQKKRAEQIEALEREAKTAGWPSEWPSSLYKTWMDRGGTTQSAQAWARAGHSPTTVLLGDPPQPEAMDDLVSRVRDEHPPQLLTQV